MMLILRENGTASGIDEFTDRDIIMDSSAFGVEGTAALIAAMARARFNL